jgi:ornithine carbamoyltransferase
VIGKDFLRISDMNPKEIESSVAKAMEMKKGSMPGRLDGKTIALLFEKPSLRTRVSFEIGIRQLGGEAIYLSDSEVGLGVREPVADVTRVLDRWVDGIIARVYSHSNLELMAQNATIPIINALSEIEHPCQAMADLLTIMEYKGRFPGQKVAFIGDGNNVAASLAVACGSVGIHFTMAVPEGYEIDSDTFQEAIDRGAKSGSTIESVRSPIMAVTDADVVYTDVWVSMGQEKELAKRIKAFQGYQVNSSLMDYAKANAIFMHDMPAHQGDEISEDMLDNPKSVVFTQAENRLHAQKALMVDLFNSS